MFSNHVDYHLTNDQTKHVLLEDADQYEVIDFVEINGVKYSKGSILFLPYETEPDFGEIIALYKRFTFSIYSEIDDFCMVIKRFETLGLNGHLQLLEIIDGEVLQFYKFSQFENLDRFFKYTFKDRKNYIVSIA